MLCLLRKLHLTLLATLSSWRSDWHWLRKSVHLASVCLSLSCRAFTSTPVASSLPRFSEICDLRLIMDPMLDGGSEDDVACDLKKKKKRQYDTNDEIDRKKPQTDRTENVLEISQTPYLPLIMSNKVTSMCLCLQTALCCLRLISFLFFSTIIFGRG